MKIYNYGSFCLGLIALMLGISCNSELKSIRSIITEQQKAFETRHREDNKKHNQYERRCFGEFSQEGDRLEKLLSSENKALIQAMNEGRISRKEMGDLMAKNCIRIGKLQDENLKRLTSRENPYKHYKYKTPSDLRNKETLMIGGTGLLFIFGFTALVMSFFKK